MLWWWCGNCQARSFIMTSIMMLIIQRRPSGRQTFSRVWILVCLLCYVAVSFLLLSVVLFCRIQAWSRDSGFAGFFLLPFQCIPLLSVGFVFSTFSVFVCWLSAAALSGAALPSWLVVQCWILWMACDWLEFSAFFLSLFAPLFSALRCNCSLVLLCCCWTNLWRRSCCCSFFFCYTV